MSILVHICLATQPGETLIYTNVRAILDMFTSFDSNVLTSALILKLTLTYGIINNVCCSKLNCAIEAYLHNFIISISISL